MTSPDSDLDALKRALRKQCVARREAISAQDRVLAARRVAETGIGFVQPRTGAVVSATIAMGAEIDPAGLVARLAAEGFRICLPVVQPRGNPLVFRAWAPGEPLVPRTWGILEPAEDAAVLEPDVLLVPLLAFDRRGMRLGYGGGYYDRTLERLRGRKSITAIGLAYAAQEIPEVPCGPHDQRLDWVLTEAGPCRF